MTYLLVISRKARNQLWAISQWYAETAKSSEVGLKWYYGFEEALQGLTRDPLRHGLAHEDPSFPFEVREILYGSGRRKTHRAIFRVVEDRVEVLTIRHVAQRDLGPDDLR